MRPVSIVEGRVVPLYRPDIDTDQIMPKQFLKRIDRSGFGEVVFFDWRAEPGFVLNDAAYAGASVLVAGPNFGAGSSREHAAWGLQQYGFEAIVAPSFGDIFATNATKIGLVTVVAPVETCERIAAAALGDPATRVRVDLVNSTLAHEGSVVALDLDPQVRRTLLEGLDDIGLTLGEGAAISEYERARMAWLPTTSH